MIIMKSMKSMVLTFTQKNKERGSSARQRSIEAKTSRTAQQPGPSGSPGHCWNYAGWSIVNVC